MHCEDHGLHHIFGTFEAFNGANILLIHLSLLVLYTRKVDYIGMASELWLFS